MNNGEPIGPLYVRVPPSPGTLSTTIWRLARPEEITAAYRALPAPVVTDDTVQQAVSQGDVQ